MSLTDSPANSAHSFFLSDSKGIFERSSDRDVAANMSHSLDYLVLIDGKFNKIIEELKVFMHHISDYVDSGEKNNFELLEINEWFDDNSDKELPIPKKISCCSVNLPLGLQPIIIMCNFIKAKVIVLFFINNITISFFGLIFGILLM